MELSMQMVQETPEKKQDNDECAFIHLRAGMRCGGIRKNHATLYPHHEFKEPEPREDGGRSLVAAARRVLAGLNARIDEASRNGEPIPVFDGIAELHTALSTAQE